MLYALYSETTVKATSEGILWALVSTLQLVIELNTSLVCPYPALYCAALCFCLQKGEAFRKIKKDAACRKDKVSIVSLCLYELSRV